jgi:hypothetical protein
LNLWDIYLTYSPVISLVFIIIGGCWAYYKFSKQQRFSEKLQNEKAKLDQQINTIIGEQKFQHERQLTNFSLFARKKHAYCIKLYEKLCQAKNDVIWLTVRIKMVPSFKDYNNDDMQKYLEQFNITSERKNQLFKAWSSNPMGRKEIQRLHDLIYERDIRCAENSILDAAKAYYQADLYMSRKLSSSVNDYMENLRKIQIEYQNHYMILHLTGIIENENLVDEINKQFPMIIEQMQRTLLDNEIIFKENNEL